MIAIASTSKIVATTRLNVPAGVMIPFLKSTESADSPTTRRAGMAETTRTESLTCAVFTASMRSNSLCRSIRRAECSRRPLRGLPVR